MLSALPTPVFDTQAQNGRAPDLGPLPEWDFSALYAGEDDPKIEADFTWAEAEATAFAQDYEGKLISLSPAELARAIERSEGMDRVMGRILSFAGLRSYQRTTDMQRGKFYADAQARVTDISAKNVFFELELNQIPDEKLQQAITENADLARYRPWIERVRAMAPYQLSDELEKFLHEKSVVGRTAWNKLFDETMAALTFDISGETLPLEAALTLLSDSDRDKRKAASEALMQVFADNIKLFARITNTLAQEKAIEDRWRGLPTPQAGRHLSNHVEPEVVEALRNAVVAAYPRLSHRYYALKAKWMGLEKMEVWDRNAPLPESDERSIPWEEAQATVMEAYHEFDPRMAQLTEPFFTEGWIDAPVVSGKAPGAFAHPTVTDAHPFVMLNYLGKQRDVMTLAHELGHGVHQRLAAQQGEYLSSTPLTLAETASVFGEMLTFQKLLDAAPDAASRKILLAGKVEDMINTVVRQIAFYDFECKLHAARTEGELTPDQINEIWMSVQAESLGPVFTFAEGYETFWCYIPHFIHSPFYVYAYAFGDGLVNALYARYQTEPEGFQDKYFAMLKAGGSKHHKELLAPFGLDASDPDFWTMGLSLIEHFIDELEAMG